MFFSDAAQAREWRATQGRIVQIAWPVMLSNITVPLLGLVDAAILGHLPDAHHLGAVAIGAQLFSILCWSFSFLRMGTVASSARSATPVLAQESLRHSLWLAAMLAIPVTLFAGAGLIPLILPLMGASPLVEQGAESYLSIRVWSVPAVFIQYVILGWFIGRGRTRIPLLLMVVTNLVNAGLDYVLVYEWGMTSDGVALGSVCADYTSLLLGLWLVHREGLQRPGRMPGWGVMAPIIRVNRDLFLRTLMLLGVLGFFHAQGAQQGDLVLAANSVLITLLLLIANALDGFAHAAESLIGQSLAQRQWARLPAVVWLTGGNSLLMALLLTLVFVLGDSHLWLALTSNAELIPVLETYQWYLFALPLAGVGSFWIDGLCIGSGATRLMRQVMAWSVFGVFFPLWWLLQGFGNHGLWLAFLALLLSRLILALGIVNGLLYYPERYTPKA